ncbi:MAG: sulfate adenylyltransferase subunit 2 [Holophagaceae bacterium]|nr:sulfate adenylyltransferase subunit 2 [Holophagaceae bacterium]
MHHLDQLENRSIHILREAYSSFRKLGMLWSIGKDSTVMLWLARKAFFGHVPFPLIHVDTTFKIPEMIAYRDRLVREWGLRLIVGTNHAALAAGDTFPSGKVDRITCCRLLKTEAMKTALAGGPGEEPFTGIIAGIRADEEGSRSKERTFSPRTRESDWDVDDQPPEFWNQYKTDFAPGTHVRIHPLLDWTELDIWEYIGREGIPTVSLYYDQGDGRRYRSLGCHPCTTPIESTAKNVQEIIAELSTGKLSGIAERSGRAQDKDDAGGLETLRRDGYM